jgi:hypothetical protein
MLPFTPLSTVPYNATIESMIRWDLATHLAAHRILNANQLALLARITYPVASRVLKAATEGTAIERIDVATLEALASAFRVKPLTLLRHSPK